MDRHLRDQELVHLRELSHLQTNPPGSPAPQLALALEKWEHVQGPPYVGV